VIVYGFPDRPPSEYIGKTVTLESLTDADGFPHRDIRAFIIREATRDEYLQYVRDHGGVIRQPLRGAKFFEISVD
jgi:hypothetical protein